MARSVSCTAELAEKEEDDDDEVDKKPNRKQTVWYFKKKSYFLLYVLLVGFIVREGIKWVAGMEIVLDEH